MSESNVKFGQPFFLAVLDSCTSGAMYDFKVDFNQGAFAEEAEAIAALRDDLDEHGGTAIIFHCVPVTKVRQHRRLVVTKLDKPKRK